jgi:erythromycin esterase
MGNEMLLERIRDVYDVIDEMKQNEEIFTEASSQLEFDFALRNLLNIKWTLEMQTLRDKPGGELFNFRDKRMYETIKWIVAQEEKRGAGRVFVFGHNGHVMKDLFDGLIPSGVHLAAYFGDEYFAIGTEFYQGRFRAIRMPHMFATSLVINDYSGLINKFIDANVDVGVLNVNRYAESIGRMGEILNSEQLMVMIGSVFHPDGNFMIPITPATSYDAIIFVRYSTPAVSVY